MRLGDDEQDYYAPGLDTLAGARGSTTEAAGARGSTTEEQR
jgi:hypothetical protein